MSEVEYVEKLKRVIAGFAAGKTVAEMRGLSPDELEAIYSLGYTYYQVGKLDEFRTLVTYLAANTAQELVYETISREIGVSSPTVKEWVAILERSGIIYILKPYYSNISKRLVKTPKCYFLDTGLAAYLPRWPTAETLMNGNAAGAFFETFVVGEILKSYYNSGKEPNLYYYRDIDKKEIDLLMTGPDCLYPMEVKKAKNPSAPDKNFGVLDPLWNKVMTSGGIHGVIASADKTHVELEVAPGTRMKVAKSAIMDIPAPKAKK